MKGLAQRIPGIADKAGARGQRFRARICGAARLEAEHRGGLKRVGARQPLDTVENGRDVTDAADDARLGIERGDERQLGAPHPVGIERNMPRRMAAVEGLEDAAQQARALGVVDEHRGLVDHARRLQHRLDDGADRFRSCRHGSGGSAGAAPTGGSSRHAEGRR